MKTKGVKSTRRKNLMLLIIGGYFLFLGIIAITRSLYYNLPAQLFYACYIGLVLIGIGTLMRKRIVVLSQVYILAIPLFVWTIDFFYLLIFKQSLWGVTNYFFSDTSSWIDSFVTLQHIYTIPLALYAAKLIGVGEIDARKWSFIQLILIFIVVSIFSPPNLNINCVFSSCIDIPFRLPYNLIWFLVSFGMVELSYLFIKKIVLRRRNSYRK